MGEEGPSRGHAYAILLRQKQAFLYIGRTAPAAPDIKSALGDRKLQLIAEKILPQCVHGGFL